MGIHTHPAVYGPMLGHEPGFVPLGPPAFYWLGLTLIALLVILIVWIFVSNRGFERTATMTKQDIFDHVSRNMLRQNSRSTRNEGEGGFGAIGCAYRGTEGRRCAIGFLIPDTEYQSNMEGLNFMDDKIERAIRKRIGREVTSEDNKLLADLLLCHDVSEPENWVPRLAKIAEEHGLCS